MRGFNGLFELRDGLGNAGGKVNDMIPIAISTNLKLSAQINRCILRIKHIG